MWQSRGDGHLSRATPEGTMAKLLTGGTEMDRGQNKTKERVKDKQTVCWFGSVPANYDE